MRGEDLNHAVTEEGATETPPHARGRPNHVALVEQGRAGHDVETPPHARGRLARHKKTKKKGWKHPRMRGEDYASRCLASRRKGNTPACAGNTIGGVFGGVADFETPPHARGRLLVVTSVIFSMRNTPACAGKTELKFALELSKRKHPRMRGEDGACNPSNAAVWETPPHARGRLRMGFVHPNSLMLAARNTPACAGKTFFRELDGVDRGKHPRMRGEDHLTKYPRDRMRETPPHARGRQALYKKVKKETGNTPACAGKTTE